MYTTLLDFTNRPAPFSRYTARELWTRPHIASRMLAYHLDKETEIASRTTEQITKIVDWIDFSVGLNNKRLCDLGCGPGLYATQFAQHGAKVTGIDFSRLSIEHAASEARRNGLEISYMHADYLADSLPGNFDVVTLIYYDYGALSPDQRRALLTRVRYMLNPGGVLILDVLGMGRYTELREQTIVEDRLMGGFWAAGDYIGMQRTMLYPADALALDRYLIIEPESCWQIFNWTQYFTPERLTAEITEAGFIIDALVGSLSGDPLAKNSETLGIIASR